MKDEATGDSTDPPRRLLLVDDDLALRRSLERVLTSAGWLVETAGDGRSALAKLTESENITVVISDIGLPDLDGIELLKQIRDRDLDLPVLLMTGRPDLESAARAVELGALRYLFKPVDLAELTKLADKAAHMYRLATLKREALEHVAQARHLMLDKAALEARFDRALTSVWMAYQPIVSWSERRVYAYEALMRPTEPSLPHPGALLGAAERLGRIHDLGRMIRDRVATEISLTPRRWPVFVNLHSHDLQDDQLFAPDSPLSRLAGDVVLEVTERAALEEVRDLRARIRKLRQLGFRMAIDDLGAGYAGLTSFAQLEPEIVKIDMALIRNIDKEMTQRRLVRSMVSLCAEMGIQVVSEGVETVEERDTLVDLGCDLMQGYLFAKPGKPFPEPAGFRE